MARDRSAVTRSVNGERIMTTLLTPSPRRQGVASDVAWVGTGIRMIVERVTKPCGGAATVTSASSWLPAARGGSDGQK